MHSSQFRLYSSLRIRRNMHSLETRWRSPSLPSATRCGLESRIRLLFASNSVALPELNSKRKHAVTTRVVYSSTRCYWHSLETQMLPSLFCEAKSIKRATTRDRAGEVKFTESTRRY